MLALKWLLDRFVGSVYQWDPKYGNYYVSDRVADIYFNVKTVKMFGWENMYLDSKLKESIENSNKLPWYAPAVYFGLQFVEIVRTLTTEMSMYLTVALYL
ncbi:hypothetical protein GGI21_006247, partial [Coemansia aciculifera]